MRAKSSNKGAVKKEISLPEGYIKLRSQIRNLQDFVRDHRTCVQKANGEKVCYESNLFKINKNYINNTLQNEKTGENTQENHSLQKLEEPVVVQEILKRNNKKKIKKSRPEKKSSSRCQKKNEIEEYAGNDAVELFSVKLCTQKTECKDKEQTEPRMEGEQAKQIEADVTKIIA